MTLRKEEIRSNNEKSVLQQIFIDEPISRIQISRNLGLNKSTVSAIYNDLKEKKLVVETGQGDSSEVGGRKPVMIKVNKDYGYTINFDLGFNHLDIMANYIEGTPFFYDRIYTVGKDIYEIVEMFKDEVRRLNATRVGLMGISVAVHGIVLNTKIQSSPFIDMQDVDLYQVLKDEFNVPVVLENEANLVAMAQRDFSKLSDKRLHNIVVFSIHKGIGAGIIIDHEIYRGEYGEAGEVGRSVYLTDFSDPTNLIKIEDFASQDAIIETIRDSLSQPSLDFAGMAKLYYKQNEQVVKAVDDFCSYLTLIIYNTAMELNPESIYISSDLVENIPELIPVLNAKYKVMSGNNLIEIFDMPGARYSSLLGGCSAVTHKALAMDGMDLKFNSDLEKIL